MLGQQLLRGLRCAGLSAQVRCPEGWRHGGARCGIMRGHLRPLRARPCLQMRRSFDTWLNPNLAEVYLSSPNAGLGGRPEPIITGRTLGGTSSINAGQWTLPAMKDVEAWGFDGALPVHS